MPSPRTLRQLAGAPAQPPPLTDCAVVVVDAQREYLDGGLPLPQVDAAVQQIARVIDAARSAGVPVIHVAHRGVAGGLFDPGAGGRIIGAVAPEGDETIVQKTLPNAFAHTDLRTDVAALDDPHLILCGFMTHMCISSTARAAVDLGLATTVLHDACATRDLPDPTGGGVVAHDVLHRTALSGLADRFSIVTDTATLLAAVG